MKVVILSNSDLRIYHYNSKEEMSERATHTLDDDFQAKDILSKIGHDDQDSEKVCLLYSTRESDPNLNALKDAFDHRDQLILCIPLIQCILWSTIENADQNIITVESGDEHARIHYHLPERNQHNRLVHAKSFSYRGLLRAVFKTFNKELLQMGYQADESEVDLSEFISALEQDIPEFEQVKSGQHVALTISYQLESTWIRSALHKTNQSLDNYINKDLFLEGSSNHILLLGNFPLLANTSQYLQEKFPRTPLNIDSISAPQDVLQRVEKGLSRYLAQEEEKTRRIQLQQEQLHLHERHNIIRRIQSSDIDLNSREQFIETFSSIAHDADMPLEILTWHIDNRIKSLYLSSELEELEQHSEKIELPRMSVGDQSNKTRYEISDEEHSVVNDDGGSSIIVEDDVDEETQVNEEPEEYQSNELKLPIDFYSEDELPKKEDLASPDSDTDREIIEKLNPFQVSDFEWPENLEDSLQLESIIETEKIYPKSEFILLKGRLKGSPVLRIFRIISTNELENIDNIQKFRRLYERESNYYADVSKVFRSNFGLFYYRKFLTGISLEDAIRQLKLDQLESLEHLNSVHLKLIFQLWKTVKSLDFSMTNFDAKNFIVLSESTTISSSEFKIMMVGFKSEIAEKEDMETKMHEMLFGLLKPQFYKEFLNKFG